MRSDAQDKKRKALAFRAFAFAFLSCMLGLSFCFIKSPQAKSEAYLAAATQAWNEGRAQDAANAALESVRLNPASVKGWRILSNMLREKGQFEAAQQAKIIAMRLQHDPDASEPLYAMPAELRLSLLALSDTDI